MVLFQRAKEFTGSNITLFQASPHICMLLHSESMSTSALNSHRHRLLPCWPLYTGRQFKTWQLHASNYEGRWLSFSPNTVWSPHKELHRLSVADGLSCIFSTGCFYIQSRCHTCLIYYLDRIWYWSLTSLTLLSITGANLIGFYRSRTITVTTTSTPADDIRILKFLLVFQHYSFN